MFLFGWGPQAAFLWARGLKRVRILAVAGLLASCSSSNPSPKISPPPESFKELQQRIALIRELPFKREVSLASESPKALFEGILSDEYGTQSLVHISRAYKRLGLLPESTDFAAALADYVRLERTFYYEARKDLIVISPDATQLVQAMREEPGRNLVFVLLLDGTTPTRSRQLADEVWKNLEAETESTVIPFDSAKKPPQLSFRIR